MPSIAHKLNAAVEVLRPAATADGPGRSVNAFSKVSDIRGRLSGLSSGDSARAQRGELLYTDVLYLDRGQDVRRGDRVRITLPGAQAVEALVVEVRTLSQDDHMEVEVRRAARGPNEQELPGS